MAKAISGCEASAACSSKNFYYWSMNFMEPSNFRNVIVQPGNRSWNMLVIYIGHLSESLPIDSTYKLMLYSNSIIVELQPPSCLCLPGHAGILKDCRWLYNLIKNYVCCDSQARIHYIQVDWNRGYRLCPEPENSWSNTTYLKSRQVIVRNYFKSWHKWSKAFIAGRIGGAGDGRHGSSPEVTS